MTVDGSQTFVRAKEFRTVVIQGVELKLELDERVFPPSRNGSFYAESVRLNAGETVIDIGTGSGVLGILAARLGGVVSATDTDSHAVEVARRNAALNGVQVEFEEGTLFGGFDRKFDVILANLPNEIVHETYLSKVGAGLAKTFDGGENGNRHILNLLRAAQRHMHESSRLYLPVHTLTDYHQTLREAISKYDARLIAVGQLPVKDFVEENLDFYLKLNEAGKIKIFHDKGRWYSHGYIYELSISA